MVNFVIVVVPGENRHMCLVPDTSYEAAKCFAPLDRFTKQLKKVLYSYKATVCLSKDACRLSLIFIHLPPLRRIFPPGLADTHGMQCPACCEFFIGSNYQVVIPTLLYNLLHRYQQVLAQKGTSSRPSLRAYQNPVDSTRDNISL